MTIPAHTLLSVQQFRPKLTRSPCATLPTHPLCPLMKKVLKGKHFANVEVVKQKMAEALKDIKINEFKNCF